MADAHATTAPDRAAAKATVQVLLRLPRELHDELRRRVSAGLASSLDSEIVSILRGELPPVEAALPPGEPFRDDSGDLAALASEQGVSPVEDVESLWGGFWPPEEETEAFLKAIRTWRDEGKTGPRC